MTDAAHTIPNNGFLDFILTESDQFVAEEPVRPKAMYHNHDDPAAVPTHLILGPSLEASSFQLSQARLERLMFGKTAAEIHTSTSLSTTLAEITRQHQCPTVCLVMRRPGCPFCREDALELSHLKQQEASSYLPFHLMGIVKDTSDARGLHELSTQYFAHPLYIDVGLETYRGLGNRTIAWRDLLDLPKGLRRTRKKHIHYNMRRWTDIIQGGVLIFDHTGTLRYAHREIYADQLRIEDIRIAIRAVQHPMNHTKQANQHETQTSIH